jgi:multidrug efflux pump subunit AcrA (membrane-fusion protein)
VSFLERAPDDAGEAPRGVRVPAAAIASRDGGEVAFVVAGEAGGEVAELRTVGTTAAPGGQRIVVSGIAPGETVVLDPPASLGDGDRIRIVAE